MSDEIKKPAIAVALEYERGTHDAPRVVATGRGLIAEQIMAVAENLELRHDQFAADEERQFGPKFRPLPAHGIGVRQ